MRALIEDGVRVSSGDLQAVERWLGVWEMAAPMRPYTELAESHGDEAERAITEELLLDLRQPVYDSRVVFLGDATAATLLESAWEDEKLACSCKGFCGLPFLRALWRVKPLVLALPAGWVQEKRR